LYIEADLKFLNQGSAPLSSLEMAGALSVVQGSPELTKRFDQKYQISNLKDAASDMAKAFTSYILQADKGPIYTVTLIIADHALSIKNGADQSATLHVTRFNGVRTLSDLDKIIDEARNSVAQMSQDSLIARAAGEGPSIDPENRDWKLREGVYRIAIVSPLYEPEVRYVQLTDRGLLQTDAYSGRRAQPKQVPDEWQVELHRRKGEDKLRIAVAPFSVTAVTQPDKRFDGEQQTLEQIFIDELNRTGHFYAFQSTKKYVIYDPGRAKGQSPLFPDADIADFQAKAYSVLAPAEVPIAPAP
jgi:hypothetical protein